MAKHFVVETLLQFEFADLRDMRSILPMVGFGYGKQAGLPITP
jgi:hypothetical protein